ncbi:hypothetical protein H7U19_06030 [Hyunsoonleella sp. SJ7]|uniref:Tetratricopeptide repeat protein n=1 Tax=Hyunsoonleella aquatilis TaxID=2762758 RepID=A0A923H8A4_9FLAO|nr:hypothetical protein [Hyunsoonleella aquatilis]MBC3757953.1 hypothetical protein [Hyunsoonleella aquatilis]
MNSHDFTYLLQNPKEVNLQKTEALRSILEDYPYFQSAKALYLKGLKHQESSDYNQALKTTAAYTTDRSILFDFITSDSFVQNEISKAIKKNVTYLNDIEVVADDISVNKSTTIDDALKQQIKETSGVLDPELFQPKDPSEKRTVPFKLDESEKIEDVTGNTKTQEASAEDILNLGKPLQFDRRESHSFNEWLKLTRYKPIKRDESQKISEPPKTEQSREKTKKSELIDRFIAENPKITPSKSPSIKGNLAKAQMIQPETLMTETLARIYVEQKNYKKAIQSYKILSLKYPEKSSFFANQIRAVEQLQEQNKKE